jgi:hypothetical protein
MSLFKFSAALLATMSMTASAAAATRQNCVTEAEGAAIMAAMMPDLIDGLRDKCGAHLPANAYLMENGQALAARYKQLADQRWPTAKLAFGRMTGEPEMAAKLPDEFFRPMLGSMVGAELVKDVTPQDCGGANRIVENLAPLPAENVANLIGAILLLAEKDGRGKGFAICKA